jgi:hypothetical protein
MWQHGFKNIHVQCFAAINEIVIYGYPVIKESKQIIITPSMITDLVQGGSVYSPSFYLMNNI